MGASASPIRLPELVSALSYALDLVEGQPQGHAVRSCVIGMRIGAKLGLTEVELRDLYFALLAKDAGCSSNATRMCQIVAGDEIAAKRAVKTTDWTRTTWETVRYAWTHIAAGAPLGRKVLHLAGVAAHQKSQAKELVEMRCDRGASIALDMGLSRETAEAIRSLDEHWNGRGYPDGLFGEEIPLLARILNLTQTLEVYWREQGAERAIEVARERAGRWFDPRLVKIAVRLARDGVLFARLEAEGAAHCLRELEPGADSEPLTDARIDDICVAFASVIDAKSSYTFRHSLGVMSAAHAIAGRLGLDEDTGITTRRAALLHDIGKLSVPNSILEKPGKLNADEWAVVRNHPYYTHQILGRIPGFGELAEIAASHHEKLDGSGYWRGLLGPQLSIPARLLVVADIYDALAAKRPYRDPMPREKVFAILESETPHALDADCVRALKESVYAGESAAIENIRLLHETLRREQEAATPFRRPEAASREYRNA
jgi:putative nucleotidyltransferase with HDIG domain